jgi:hypothetical protein
MCLAAVTFSGTIAGQIVNVSALADGVKEDTFIQLVPDGKAFTFTKTAAGTIDFKSDLDRAPFPSDGKIAITVKNLKPGRYVLALQAYHGDFMAIFFKNPETKQPIVLTIPKAASVPTEIDLGKGFFEGVPVTGRK